MKWQLLIDRIRAFVSDEDELLVHCRLNSDPEYIGKLVKKYRTQNKAIDDECLYYAIWHSNAKTTSTLLHHGVHGNLYRDDKRDHKHDDRFILTHALVPATMMVDYNPLVERTFRSLWSKPLDTLCVVLYAGVRDIDFDSPRLLEHDDTALICAARYLDPIVTALLIGSGAPVDAQNAIGETAMIVTITNGYDLVAAKEKILRQLMTAGANPTLRDVSGRSALDYASEQRSKPIRCLVREYCDHFVRQRKIFPSRAREIPE